ncbi:MAG: oligosaccharide flippase family protein [Firmicutes bacterium]|nr:oligosaccharide flippase family protein [Bacillota bacterium]
MKKTTYLQGAFILSLTNILTGIIAFIYRIFLTKTVGAEGIGIYQLVLPLYYFFITLVSSGLVTTISKLIAENRVKKNFSNIYHIIKVGLIISGIWSSLLAIFIAFNSSFLGTYILKDERTAYPILIFSPAIIFIALSAVLKGYFYGMEKVSIPSSIDIVEKLIRLIILVVITRYFINHGIVLICAGAMFAMVCGEILSLILLFTFYHYKRNLLIPRTKIQTNLSIIKNILIPLLPLSISGAIENILDMIDAVLIPSKLVEAGFSKQSALSLYGELTGMVFPLLYFPLIIIASLSTTLIPSIAYSYASNNSIALNKKCNDSMAIASIIGFASAVVFTSYPSEYVKSFIIDRKRDFYFFGQLFRVFLIIGYLLY